MSKCPKYGWLRYLFSFDSIISPQPFITINQQIRIKPGIEIFSFKQWFIGIDTDTQVSRFWNNIKITVSQMTKCGLRMSKIRE